MRNYQRPFYIVLIAILVILSSCKKDEDGEAPTVTILSPSENDIFNYNESIPIQVKVSDNEKIDQVIIEILNTQNAKFLSTVQLQGNSSSQTFDATIMHDDLYLESGSYYIRVKASDGQNDAFDFQDIQLNAAVKTLNRIFLVKDSGNGQCSIDSLNSSGVFPATTFAHSADFCFADIKQNDLVIASNDEQTLGSYDLPLFYLETSRDLDIDGGEIMTTQAQDENGWNNYLGFNDGDIRVLTENGLYQNAVFAANDDPIQQLLITDQFIISYAESSDGVFRTLSNYLKSSGSLQNSISSNVVITGIIETDDSNRLLLSVDDDSQPLMYYNIATNAFNDVFTFMENSAAYGIWKANGQNYYVAHATGLTYYNNSTGNYQVYPIFGVEEVKYEPVTNRTFVVTSTGVSVYSENLSTLLFSHSVIDIKDLVFWYNK